MSILWKGSSALITWGLVTSLRQSAPSMATMYSPDPGCGSHPARQGPKKLQGETVGARSGPSKGKSQRGRGGQSDPLNPSLLVPVLRVLIASPGRRHRGKRRQTSSVSNLFL